MKILIVYFLSLLAFSSHGMTVSETVYVESPTDTDHDGVPDRIYVTIKRPLTDKKLSTIYEITPYGGGTYRGVDFHNVDLLTLPQDDEATPLALDLVSRFKESFNFQKIPTSKSRVVYASVNAHSLGTGHSTGCPTVGDPSEIAAAKSVIDWLNGRARAFDVNGQEVKADWANGKVGMTGTSYNGTLPIMVASTGVEGLKAIIPVAAISNWYDYYRANGLVINPHKYIGEDADVIGHFIVRQGTCKSELDRLTETMGREHGDYSPFWQIRNSLANAKKMKAATFIIHGQADWNVKGKHAIQLWEALEGVVPRRMILHRGGHGLPSVFGTSQKIRDWFDHFLEDVDNGITRGPLVQVEHADGSLSTQEKWPHENTARERLYFSSNAMLSNAPTAHEELSFTDTGKTKKMNALLAFPGQQTEERLLFITAPFENDRILSGTTRVNLRIAVKNRKAANLSIAIVEYNKHGKRTIVTRGWADPQNYRNLENGEKLVPGKKYDLSFDIEPKQHRFKKGSQLGILIASTDYDFTMRPDPGTIIQLTLGEQSFVDLMLSK